MNLQECIDAAKKILRERAEQNAGNKGRLFGLPHIMIYDQRSKTMPGIVGDLRSCDQDGLLIDSPEARIKYLPVEHMSIIENFPVTIVLEWLESQSSGYYGETQAEYGGEPFRLPTTAARLIIEHAGPNNWKIID